MQYQRGSLLPIHPTEPTAEDFHDAKLAARKESIDQSDVIGLWALTNPAPRLVSIFHNGQEFVPGDSQPFIHEAA